jgi:hypothetical protein
VSGSGIAVDPRKTDASLSGQNQRTRLKLEVFSDCTGSNITIVRPDVIELRSGKILPVGSCCAFWGRNEDTVGTMGQSLFGRWNYASGLGTSKC